MIINSKYLKLIKQDAKQLNDYFLTYYILVGFQLDLIDEFKDSFNQKHWEHISFYIDNFAPRGINHIKEDFLEKHKDKVNWNILFVYHGDQFSKKFRLKFNQKAPLYFRYI